MGQSQAQRFTFLDTQMRVALFWHGTTVAYSGLEVLHLELELKLSNNDGITSGGESHDGDIYYFW